MQYVDGWLVFALIDFGLLVVYSVGDCYVIWFL